MDLFCKFVMHLLRTNESCGEKKNCGGECEYVFVKCFFLNLQATLLEFLSIGCHLSTWNNWNIIVYQVNSHSKKLK